MNYSIPLNNLKVMFGKLRLGIILFGGIAFFVFLGYYLVTNSLRSKAALAPGECNSAEQCFVYCKPISSNPLNSKCISGKCACGGISKDAYKCATTICNDGFCTCYTSAQTVVVNPTSCPVPIPSLPITPTPQPSSRVFVTSTTYNGNLGGLKGANDKCQERANTAKLGGIWTAWLSGDNSSPSQNFVKNNIPYKRIDGLIIANNWEDLTDGQLQNSISVTETGKILTNTTDINVWTNTKIDGSIKYRDSNYSCFNWKTSSNQITATMGLNNISGPAWTDNNNISTCAILVRLYCFEQLSSVLPTIPVPTHTPLPPPYTPVPPIPTHTPLPPPNRSVSIRPPSSDM